MRAVRQVLSERVGGQAERGGRSVWEPPVSCGIWARRTAESYLHQTKGWLSNSRRRLLWEMGDVAAMFDAGQAKEESTARPPFEVYE